MSKATELNKPRHQQASDWADSALEHLHWMESRQRGTFLEEMVELGQEHLSDFKMAMAIGSVFAIKCILKEGIDTWDDDEDEP